MAALWRVQYGRCPCSGHYESRGVEVKMTVHGKLIVLADVPQGACPNCGSRVYKLQVLEYVESAMRGKQTNNPQSR
jgi:YgiT-type zinc finger domain-containing protein